MENKKLKTSRLVKISVLALFVLKISGFDLHAGFNFDIKAGKISLTNQLKNEVKEIFS